MKKFFNSLLWLVVAYSYVLGTSSLGQVQNGFAQFLHYSCLVYVFILIFDNLNGDSNMGGWVRLLRQFDYLVKSRRTKVETQPEFDMPFSDVMIYHSPKTAKSRSTIVARYDAVNNEICFAASRCSKNEQFSRRIGRNIAIQRLNAGECIQSVKVTGEDSPQFTFLSIAKNLAIWLEENPNPVA